MIQIVHTTNIIASNDTRSYKNAFQTNEKYERSGKVNYDTYQETSDEPDCCETYHDWSKINVGGYVPVKSRLYSALHNDIHCFMENYHRGNYSKDEVKDYMKKCCEIKMDYAIWSTPEKQISEEEKENIIRETFAIFEERNAGAVVQVCLKEGKQVCESKGYHQNDYSGYVYYNAEWYYSWKDMKSDLEQFMDEIGKELLGVEKEYHSTYHEYGFNKAWNVCFGERFSFPYKASATEEPPKGFLFFYRNSEEVYVKFQEENQTDDIKEKKFQRKFQWNNLINILGTEHLDFLKRFFRRAEHQSNGGESAV